MPTSDVRSDSSKRSAVYAQVDNQTAPPASSARDAAGAAAVHRVAADNATLNAVRRQMRMIAGAKKHPARFTPGSVVESTFDFVAQGMGQGELAGPRDDERNVHEYERHLLMSTFEGMDDLTLYGDVLVNMGADEVALLKSNLAEGGGGGRDSRVSAVADDVNKKIDWLLSEAAAGRFPTPSVER